jgi:hypothetical protein
VLLLLVRWCWADLLLLLFPMMVLLLHLLHAEPEHL